ncbi:hypothetical protein Bpro_4461 [Polaromonas sp. JS666]|nr:hypothetical protein Bpro_4461 [Polaromonas sp. JS666]
MKLSCSFYSGELLPFTIKFTNSGKIFVGTILQTIWHRKHLGDTVDVGRNLQTMSHRKLINKVPINEPNSGKEGRIWAGSNSQNVINHRFTQHNVMSSLQF